MGLRALWGGTRCYVPRSVAVCPECGGELAAHAMSMIAATGQPVASAIEIECLTDLDGRGETKNGLGHRWFQSDWKPVRDAVAKWSGAFLDFGR